MDFSSLPKFIAKNDPAISGHDSHDATRWFEQGATVVIVMLLLLVLLLLFGMLLLGPLLSFVPQLA
jgi:hypothetical protein